MMMMVMMMMVDDDKLFIKIVIRTSIRMLLLTFGRNIRNSVPRDGKIIQIAVMP